MVITTFRKKLLIAFLFLTVFAFVVPVVGAKGSASAGGFDLNAFLGFNPRELRSSSLHTSGYYNLTGTKIIIDDSDPNYNWSKTAAENPWCSGSGTLKDPYVIENVYIDGGMNLTETYEKPRTANCVSIYYSTAYFIVRDCYFTKAGTNEFNSGIYLAYTENGIIYNNTMTYNNQAVFVNRDSHNNTILYNVIENDQNLQGPNRAMYLQYSDDNLVVRNLVINCYTGIQVAECIGTEIRQNLLNSSLFGYPVTVGMNFIKINDSKITYNVLAGDYTGTTFSVTQVSSSGNIIQNNTVTGSIPSNLGTPSPPKSSSSYTDLIRLADSYFNTVAHNLVFVPGYVAPSSEIPSYDLALVFGSIGLVSSLLIVKTRKNNRKQ